MYSILPCILAFYRVFWRFTVYFGVSTAGDTKNANGDRTDASKTPKCTGGRQKFTSGGHAKIHGETPKYMQNTRSKKRFSFDEIVAVAAATIKYTENTR